MIDINEFLSELKNKLAKPDKTIREHTDEVLNKLEILYQLNYLCEEDYKLLKYCCEYHDYGKVNDEFQKRVSSTQKITFDDSKEVAHNVLSLCFINKDEFTNEDDYYKVCYAILNHHHHTLNFKEIKIKANLIQKFIERYDAYKINNQLLLNRMSKQKTNPQAIRLKGLLHKCDYAASGGYDIEYENDFLIASLNNNLLANWRKINESANWNQLQEFCIEKRDENIIIVANTGMGKTEAGLLWIGDNKGFFILPLRTAINAIYDRVRKDILLDEKIANRISLLHSDAISYYLKESVIEEDKVIEYGEKGKNLAMPLTISTLDQLFSFVYKYNGFELKLATLSYSKIVIDEIQAYSPDLLAYLVIGLEQIVELGGKFAILTATLPPFIKDYIEESIGKIEFKKFTQGKTRHHLKVVDEEIDSLFIANHFKEKGGKTLVICNTVKKAQEIYDSLSEEFDLNVNLIHSKFIKKDRKEKEDQIIKFGDGEKTKKGNAIWVATSIVEASLDIDFDYLFTELNDLNGLFQRLGRVNRKGYKAHMLDSPNCYVFTKINEKILKDKDKKTGFIDKTIYNLSKEAILGYQGLLSEDNKVELIEKTLTSQNIKGSSFDYIYRQIREYVKELYVGELEEKKVQEIFRNIISYNIIPKSVYEENKSFIDYQNQILEKKFKFDKQKSIEENEIIKNNLFQERFEARDKINSFTISVGPYDLSKRNKQEVREGKVPIVRCKYSFERGFERAPDITNDATKEKVYDMFY